MNSNNKSYYKILDDKGRLAIPKELREIASIHPGDVLKISATSKSISLHKVGIVDHEGQNIYDTESILYNALQSLPKTKQIRVAKSILNTLERTQNNDSET